MMSARVAIEATSPLPSGASLCSQLANCFWDALTPRAFVFVLLHTDLSVMVLWNQGAQGEL